MTESTLGPENIVAAKGQALAAVPANSQIQTVLEQEHVKRLAEELRCLVCQNQTIADSNSGLAIDLRGQIIEQIRAGKSDVAIKQYMVERYGEFVLYNPPFSAGNAALWIGPFLLLAIGVWLAVRVLRKNARASALSGHEPDLNSAKALEIEQRYQQEASNRR